MSTKSVSFACESHQPVKTGDIGGCTLPNRDLLPGTHLDLTPRRLIHGLQHGFFTLREVDYDSSRRLDRLWAHPQSGALQLAGQFRAWAIPVTWLNLEEYGAAFPGRIINGLP